MIAHDYELKPSVKKFIRDFDPRIIIYGIALIYAFMLGFILAGGV